MSATEATTTATESDIGLQKAVDIAREYLERLFPAEKHGLRLEETEFAENRGEWAITYSLARQGLPMRVQQYGPTMFEPATQPLTRDYKSIRIDAQSGKVKSMSIRQL